MEKERVEFSEKIEDFYKTPASEIMVGSIPHIPRDEPIRKVIEEISKKAIDHLWVMDNDKKLVGIITEKDLLNALKEPLFGAGVAWDALEIKSLLYRDVKIAESMMTTRLFKCEPHTDLKTVIKCMVDNRIRHIPILEGEELKGEININQIIKLVNKKFFE